jgi:hypothetical protein
MFLVVCLLVALSSNTLSANVLGAEAVSEFTDKSLFKERLPGFSPKLYSKCKIAY